MSISIHIPFYNPNPQKKEGFRQLTRFDFLKENIENLKKLSIKSDIFVHTHNNFLDDKKLEAQIINHEISESNLEKGHLTWLSRPLMEKQKDDYDISAHDMSSNCIGLRISASNMLEASTIRFG